MRCKSIVGIWGHGNPARNQFYDFVEILFIHLELPLHRVKCKLVKEQRKCFPGYFQIMVMYTIEGVGIFFFSNDQVGHPQNLKMLRQGFHTNRVTFSQFVNCNWSFRFKPEKDFNSASVGKGFSKATDELGFLSIKGMF